MRRKYLVPAAVVAAALGGGAVGTIAIAGGQNGSPDRVERFGGPPPGTLELHAGPAMFASDALAEALGITQDQLLDRFQDGDTVGDIAKAEGKDLDDVRAAVRDELVAAIDDQLEDLGDFGGFEGPPGFRGGHPGPPPGFGYGRP